jgi:transposase
LLGPVTYYLGSKRGVSMAKWTAAQKAEALAIAEASSIREAAEQTGVPEGTIKRWRSEAKDQGPLPAKTKNPEVQPQSTGRPSKFREEFIEQAFKLCLLGAIDTDLANFFEVDIATLYRWKNQFPRFCEALKKGKQVADAEVASRLFHRALGYSHAEDKIFQYEGEPVVVPTTKHYPPDTTAAIFWLKNRQPQRWRDKVQLTGHLTTDVTIEIAPGAEDAEAED